MVFISIKYFRKEPDVVLNYISSKVFVSARQRNYNVGKDQRLGA